nr:hypothetical protein BRC25_02455 [Ipomoea batatas]
MPEAMLFENVTLFQWPHPNTTFLKEVLPMALWETIDAWFALSPSDITAGIDDAVSFKRWRTDGVLHDVSSIQWLYVSVAIRLPDPIKFVVGRVTLRMNGGVSEVGEILDGSFGQETISYFSYAVQTSG